MDERVCNTDVDDVLVRSNIPLDRHLRGITLIEVMIVVVIIGIAMTGIGFATGAVTRTSLRAGSMRIISISKWAYHRSVSQGTTVRLLFDFEKGTMSVEEAHGRITLKKDGSASARGGDSDSEKGESDAWAEAQARLQEVSFKFDESEVPSSFSPISGSDGAALSKYAEQPIGKAISILKIISPHEPEPREQGKSAIYFFPGGRTEHSVVQLSNPSGQVFSIEIHPLTGRGKIYPYAYEPEVMLDEESEVEDS